jgi:hypothetical protein
MSYLNDFEHSFMQHTLKLLDDYKGEFDATLLVNCLLGLLVIPKESFSKHIPEDPLSELSRWGISPESILEPGRQTGKNPRPETLRGLVINLRRAVAHFKITPVPPTSDVYAFEYRNDLGTARGDQTRRNAGIHAPPGRVLEWNTRF